MALVLNVYPNLEDPNSASITLDRLRQSAQFLSHSSKSSEIVTAFNLSAPVLYGVPTCTLNAFTTQCDPPRVSLTTEYYYIAAINFGGKEEVDGLFLLVIGHCEYFGMSP